MNFFKFLFPASVGWTLWCWLQNVREAGCTWRTSYVLWENWGRCHDDKTEDRRQFWSGNLPQKLLFLFSTISWFRFYWTSSIFQYSELLHLEKEKGLVPSVLLLSEKKIQMLIIFCNIRFFNFLLSSILFYSKSCNLKKISIQ